MPGDFFDSNVVLYLLDDSDKADRAAALMAGGGTISTQVLNEVLVNCIRKAGMSWQEAGEFLSGIRAACRVIDLSVSKGNARQRDMAQDQMVRQGNVA